MSSLLKKIKKKVFKKQADPAVIARKERERRIKAGVRRQRKLDAYQEKIEARIEAALLKADARRLKEERSAAGYVDEVCTKPAVSKKSIKAAEKALEKSKAKAARRKNLPKTQARYQESMQKKAEDIKTSVSDGSFTKELKPNLSGLSKKEQRRKIKIMKRNAIRSAEQLESKASGC